MTELNKLTKMTIKSKRRLGRGLGSGRGKTSGRGTKGQKARGKVPTTFSGGGLPLYKKLPFRRGLGNRKVTPDVEVIHLKDLATLPAKTVVNLENLAKMGILSGRQAKKSVKILGPVEIKVALEVHLPVSKSVREAIEKAGGSVVQSL